MDPSKNTGQTIFDSALNYNENNFIETAEALEVGKNAYLKLAKLLYEKGKSVRDAFEGKIYDDYVYGKVEELVTLKDFKDILAEIGFGELTKEEEVIFCAKLQRAQMKDEMIVNDLIQDLEHFGVKETNLRKRDGLEYNILESKSIRVLNRVHQYLKKENSTPSDLFNGVIEIIEVKGLDAVANLEIVQSEAFFKRLHEKGLIHSNTYIENLCFFLCLDREFVDYLRIDKLVKVLNEFDNNSFFRDFGTVVSLVYYW